MNICNKTISVPAVATGLVLAATLLGGSSAQAYWVHCAQGEHEVCHVPFPTVVRYGAYGHYFSHVVPNGSTRCDTVHFGGDPAPGAQKSCFFAD